MEKIKSVVIAGGYLCQIIETEKLKYIAGESHVKKQARLPVKKNG